MTAGDQLGQPDQLLPKKTAHPLTVFDLTESAGVFRKKIKAFSDLLHRCLVCWFPEIAASCGLAFCENEMRHPNPFFSKSICF